MYALEEKPWGKGLRWDHQNRLEMLIYLQSTLYINGLMGVLARREKLLQDINLYTMPGA